MTLHETDYLVIGGGAMSCAFVDALLTGDKTATVTIIERRARLGGHWCNAYPYVTLHQPALFYGVNSIKLGNGSTDLSTLDEILAYFDKVLDRFIKTGRVTFLSGHEYLGANNAAPMNAKDETIEFRVKKRVVNGTYMGVEIPSTHPPKFEVADDVPFMPPNNLPEQIGKWDNYYVLGCGKTGIDAVLYLLRNGVSPDKINWVMSSDIWCFDRSGLQVGTVMDTIIDQCNSVRRANTPDDIFLQLEGDSGDIMRLDKDVLPTKWKCATLSPAEMKELRPVKNKIRYGRIKKLNCEGIEFADQNLGYPDKTLFINCTADALASRAPKPVFTEGHIDLQSVFFCQQVFSAAAIAGLETCKISDKMRNWVRPVPHPERPAEWPHLLSITMDNALKLHVFMPIWMLRSRLFYLSHEPFLRYLKYATKALFISHPLRRAARRLSR
ncbi:MAG: hypothetical protein ABJP33_14355 [Pseudoruegeria sp.]